MLQDDYSVAFEIVKRECEMQLRAAELPQGIQDALDRRGLIFGEHPEVMAILPLVIYRAVGGKDVRKIAAVGAAMEFLLAAADILDDVQDRYVPESARPPERLQAHYINEMELFTALMLLGEQAAVSLVGEDLNTKRSNRAISLFNSFKMKAFSGQYADAHGKVDFDSDLEASIAITRAKCGSLARCSAQMGAVLATDDEDVIELTGQYAEHLALARQIHDDVSNLWPRTGRGEDLEQLKSTLPLTYSLNMSQNGDSDSGISSLAKLVALDKAAGPRLGVSADDSGIAQARSEIFETGGIHFAVLQALIHLVKARSIGRRIEKLPPGEGVLDRLASA